MQILGLPILVAFKTKHADSRGPLESWQEEAERAEWKNTQDVKNRYRSADFLANNRVIFNIKGNSYRLVTTIQYPLKLILVNWIGTHAEYSKKKF